MTIRTSIAPPCWPRGRTHHHRRLHSDIPPFPCRLDESILAFNRNIINNNNNNNGKKHHRRWASASNAPVDLCLLASRAAEERKTAATTGTATTDCLLSWVDLNSSTTTSSAKDTRRDPPPIVGNDSCSSSSFVVSRAAATTRILPNLARSAEGIANPPHNYTGVTRPKRSATDKSRPYQGYNGNEPLTEAQRPLFAVPVTVEAHAPVHPHQSQEKYRPASHNTEIQDCSHVSGSPTHNHTGLCPPQPQKEGRSNRTMAATLPAASPFFTPPLAPHSNPVQSLMDSVVHVVESVHEQHRRAQCRKRISQTLLTLRAAAEIQHQWEQQQLDHDVEKAAEEAQDTLPDSSSDFCDLGSALFCPLMDPVLLKGHHSHSHALDSRLGRSSSISTTTTIDMEEDSRTSSSRPMSIHTDQHIMNGDHRDEKKTEDSDDFRPVHILPEPNIHENPRLLTEDQFQQLITDGVPECLHMNAWERIYSMGRDGDSFRTLLDRCNPYQYSIMVVQTTSGYLLGGFVSDAWQEQDHQKHSYYGTGVSFLFASHPVTDNHNNNHTDDKQLSIFPWTGSNDFCQICDMERNFIAMGGSGAFGFILEDNLFRGSTDHCGTFDNPPLTPDKDGIFTVAAMEVYGLVPLFEKAVHHHYHRQECPTGSSPRSTVLSAMASAMIDHLH